MLVRALINYKSLDISSRDIKETENIRNFTKLSTDDSDF